MLGNFVIKIVAFIALGVVLWFGFQPEPALDPRVSFGKYSQIAAFAFFSLSLLVALPDWPKGFTAIVAFAAGLVIASGQAWLLPFRSFDSSVLVINATGIAIALFLYGLISLLVMAASSKRNGYQRYQSYKAYKNF